MTDIKKEICDYLEVIREELPVVVVKSSWPEHIQEAVVYINKNMYDKELMVTTLRERLYTRNNNNFSSEFAYYVGTTPKTYMLNLRLESAKLVMLQDRYQEVGLWTIANELGFTSDDAFIHAFRKKEGVTPSKWRKRETE